MEGARVGCARVGRTLLSDAFDVDFFTLHNPFVCDG
jgi:hypothetical protein